jgi:hypothetical protein
MSTDGDCLSCMAIIMLWSFFSYSLIILSFENVLNCFYYSIGVILFYFMYYVELICISFYLSQYIVIVILIDISVLKSFI